MRFRPGIVCVAAAVAIGVAPGVGARVDTALIAKIRDEGLKHSQVMDTIFWLTDRYGPRLTGSPEFEEAGDWTVARLQSWGLANVHTERFSSGHGWSLLNFHATMTSPRAMPIIGMPKAWTLGTSGTISADVARPIITTAEDAARWHGRLRGKIVLTQPARDVRMLEYGDGAVVRYSDHDGTWLTEAMTPQPPAAAPAAPRPIAPPFDVMAFYRAEGVAALFDRGPSSDLAPGGSDLSWVQQRLDGGTVFVEAGASPYADPAATLPQVTLAVEHYNRIVRLLAHDVPVRVELNIQTRFTDETAAHPNSFNILAEIPGREKPDEIVIIGAHFDSWQGGTGATDNAAGAAAMMEAMRILHAVGARPKRTIRLGLWGGEEEGLTGSAAYVAAHLGTRAAPGAEHSRTSVYFNLDNGTGPVHGVWTEGNDAARAIFEGWSGLVADLGVTIFSPRGVPSTDHVSFQDAGVPAFQFVQERYEYNSRTHHSTMDVYDRIQADDVKQAATVAAVFAWQAAQRDDLMPRVTAAGGR